MLEYLKKLQETIDAQDPLLQRGIEKDWVCVVHPAIEYKLRQKAIEVHGDFPYIRLSGLEMMTRRKTYVETAAPMEVQYMSQDEYLKRYGKP